MSNLKDNFLLKQVKITDKADSDSSLCLIDLTTGQIYHRFDVKYFAGILLDRSKILLIFSPEKDKYQIVLYDTKTKACLKFYEKFSIPDYLSSQFSPRLISSPNEDYVIVSMDGDTYSRGQMYLFNCRTGKLLQTIGFEDEPSCITWIDNETFWIWDFWYNRDDGGSNCRAVNARTGIINGSFCDVLTGRIVCAAIFKDFIVVSNMYDLDLEVFDKNTLRKLREYKHPASNMLDHQSGDPYTGSGGWYNNHLLFMQVHPLLPNCLLSMDTTGLLVASDITTGNVLATQQWFKSFHAELDLTEGKFVLSCRGCITLYAEVPAAKRHQLSDPIPSWEVKWSKNFERPMESIHTRTPQIISIASVVSTISARATSAASASVAGDTTAAVPASRAATYVPTYPAPRSNSSALFSPPYCTTPTQSVPILTIDQHNPLFALHLYLVDKQRQKSSGFEARCRDFTVLLQVLKANATGIGLNSYLSHAPTFYRRHLFASCVGKDRNRYHHLRQTLSHFTDGQLAQHLAVYLAYLQGQTTMSTNIPHTEYSEALRLNLAQTLGLTQPHPSYYQPTSVVQPTW